MTSPIFPKPLQILIAIYFAASLAHFAHNAEYIAYYPGMPRWLTRESVYLSWLANITIWSEAFTGLTLLVVATLLFARQTLGRSLRGA